MQGTHSAPHHRRRCKATATLPEALQVATGMAVLDHLLRRTQAQHGSAATVTPRPTRASLGVSSSNSMTSMPLERNQP
jgi:hypothetical protein